MPQRKRIPYKELDPNMVQLVRALNAFEGITTLGSCGGHANPTNASQYPAGSWYIKFQLARNDEGWIALEFLAWLINNSMRRGNKEVYLYPFAAPPYLNSPGEELDFIVEGIGVDSEDVAQWINKVRGEVFIAPSQLKVRKRKRKGRKSKIRGAR